MKTTNFKNEIEIANNYFHEAVMEIEDKEMLKGHIKDLLSYLHSNNFSINDVLGFYSLSDLQDEFDIIRLMEYFHVSDKPKEQNTIAQSQCGYLVLMNNDDEI